MFYLIPSLFLTPIFSMYHLHVSFLISVLLFYPFIFCRNFLLPILHFFFFYVPLFSFSSLFFLFSVQLVS